MIEVDLVDKPWSYVIAVSSFIAQTLIGGYAFTSGIFYEVFTQTFEDANPILISCLSSLPICTWFAGCPLGSIVINKFGLRKCCFLGGTMASLGLFLCYFSTHFVNILICYGIISGLGHGVLYAGFVTAVNTSFRKYRTPITIFCTLGPYFGLSGYSFLIPHLKEHYALNGTFLILSGMSLNICACACTLFSLPSIKSKSKVCINKKLITSNPWFSLFSLQNICCNLSNSLILVHLPSLVISKGFSTNNASLALTVFGMSNCLGKLVYGIGGYFRQVDVVLVYTISLIVYGISTILIPINSNFFWILCFAAMAAFFYNVTGGHNFLVIQELLGEDNFADGVGICYLIKSFGVFLAGPVAGLLLITCGCFHVTFYVSGSVMLIGCLLMVPVCIHQRRVLDRHSVDKQITISVDDNDASRKMLTERQTEIT